MRSGTANLFSILAGTAVLWLLARFLLPAAFPFLLGTGLALAAEPGVSFLSRRLHLPRSAASGIGVTAVFLLICTVFVLLFSFLFRELGILAGILPDMEQMVRSGLDSLQAWLLTLSDRAPGSLRLLLRRNVIDLFSGGSALLDRFTRHALGLAGTLLGHIPDSALGLGTGLLSAFLISAKLPQIRQWLRDRLSASRMQKAADVLKQIRCTAGLWLTAQLKLTGITYAILTPGLLLLRIPFAPLWALAVAAVDAFPILGTGTVLVPWSIVCLLRHNSAAALGLLGIYGIVTVTRTVLEPRLVGRQLGLDPLATLIALYAGFRLWGVLGMILMPMLTITAIRVITQAGGEEEIRRE